MLCALPVQPATSAQSDPDTLESTKATGANIVYHPKLVPTEIESPYWFTKRRVEQTSSAAGSKTYHDFRFEDRIVESGIRFRNLVVPDGGIVMKAVHYDHGNGVAVA
ncbi:unnamed protein product, partial [marine sediment metagenome]